MSDNVWFIAMLIFAGMVLVLFEFLTVSFGILTIFAVVSFGAAIWLAFSISPLAGLVALVAIAVGLPLYIIALVRILPHTKVGRVLFLAKVPQDTGAGTPDAVRLPALVGKEAVAETMLRPGGMIRLDGRRIDAQAESGIINAGTKVRIVGISMGNAVVRAV